MGLLCEKCASKLSTYNPFLTKENAERIFNALAELTHLKSLAHESELVAATELPSETVMTILEYLQREGKAVPAGNGFLEGGLNVTGAEERNFLPNVSSGASGSSTRSPKSPQPISCPEYGSTKLYRDGQRYLSDASAMALVFSVGFAETVDTDFQIQTILVLQGNGRVFHLRLRLEC